ncbi:MAG: site-specific integrase, partial [Candidatus Woesearchaeota archaeon]
MELNQAINKFLDYCSVEKSYSDKTINSYKLALEQFIQYLDENYDYISDVLTIESCHIRPFLAWLHNKKYKNRSIRIKISALKSFFKFLFKRNFINKNPASNLSMPKCEKKLPSFLLKNEIEALITSFDVDTPEGARNIALIELLYSSGLRI